MKLGKRALSISILCLLMLIFLTATAFAHDPVILIPGLTAQPSAMDTMKNNFINAGWPSNEVFTWTDSTNMTGDLAQAGVELGNKINSVLSQTGKQKVVLVTWSASTLAARSCLKNVPGAQDKVSMYFSMAGPHHGTTTASGCTQYTACRQFAIGSAFLADLNSGTEVPGSPNVVYTTLRSTGDINVNPCDSAMLEGANNILVSSSVNHFTFPSDAGVFNTIKELIIAHGETPAIPAPTQLAVTSFTDDSVSLTWTAASGVEGYNVYRATNPAGPWTKANTNMITGTSFTATELESDTLHYFVVRSVDNGDESDNSNQVSQYIGEAPVIPVPTQLTVTDYNDVSVSLTWTAASGVDGYNVYYAADSVGPWVKANPSMITSTSYTVTGLETSTTYYFVVRSVDYGIESENSNQVIQTTNDGPSYSETATDTATNHYLAGRVDFNEYLALGNKYGYISNITLYHFPTYWTDDPNGEPILGEEPTVVPAPTGLNVSDYAENSVALSWTAASGVDGYNVYYATDSDGPWTKGNTSPITGTSYTVTGLASGTTYYFVARSVDNDIESANSNQVSQTTGTAPGYSETATDTVINHYLAGRITTNEYNSLGAEYGYNTTITIYHFEGYWTDDPNGTPIL